MLEKLYDRCLDLARHKLSKPFLAFVSFIESSFFPIPPDVMIVPMVLAKKDEYFKICKDLRLRPSNIIHACFSIDRSVLFGMKNFFY